MDVQVFAEQILLGSRLEDKLLQPDILDYNLQRSQRFIVPEQPGRPAALSFAVKGQRLPFPSLHELENEKARGIVLHFFANHELLAIEILALALLRFPEAPLAFRQGLVRTIREEQEHLCAYQLRMNALGVQFGDVPVNRFFWDCLKSMDKPLDFVVGMSLTFEQANLDFAKFYEQTFARIGDHETAALLRKVYEDEIGHVKNGSLWLERWKLPEQSQWEAYTERLHLPLSPARAKGPIFDFQARRRAELSKEYCEQLFVYSGTKGRPPALFWYNSDCELELSRESPGYNPNQGTRKIMGELMGCMMFVAKPGDVVLLQKPPTLAYLSRMKELGFDLPEFCALPDEPEKMRNFLRSRRWERFYPWGWTPRSLEMARTMHQTVDAQLPIELSKNNFWDSPWMQLFRKSALPRLRLELRQASGQQSDALWGPIEADGALLHDMTDVLVAIGKLHAAFQAPAVIKSPYGFAGSGMLRAYQGQDLSEAQLGWIERQLELYGAVLIEPWLKRVTDLSVVWSGDSESLNSFVFYTNAKGQYKGHSLQPLNYALTPSQRAFLFETSEGSLAAYEQLLQVATQVRQKLRDHGYRYAAGIDTMLYELNGNLHLRILGEVNCRMTMGHIARGLRKRISPVPPSIWQTVSVLEAQARGWPSLKAMAEELETLHPVRLKKGIIEEGIFFTNDPAQSTYVLSMVAVGRAAIASCHGLGVLERSHPSL